MTCKLGCGGGKAGRGGCLTVLTKGQCLTPGLLIRVGFVCVLGSGIIWARNKQRTWAGVWIGLGLGLGNNI